MTLRKISSIFIVLILLFACHSNSAVSDKEIDSLEWEEQANEFAHNFAIQKVGNHSRLLVFGDKSRSDTVTKLYKGSYNCINTTYIQVDSIASFATLSSTYVGFIDALNQYQKISFVDETDYIYSKRVRKSIENKKITECGSGENLNYELLLNTKPLVLAYQIEGGSKALLERLEEINLPYLNCTDFKESSPLGRAEWLKVFGYLCGEEQAAETLFNEIMEHYSETQYFCNRILEKPSVFSGSVFGGVWNVSGGKSFLAQLIKDAGGIYAFANDTISLNITSPFEKVYQKCKSTNVWLHPSYYHTFKEIKEEDKRYALFDAFKNQRVYNNNKMENGLGGNAYWEMGVVRPDIVLKDIAQCLHPEVFKGNTTIFYKAIE